MTRYLEDAFKVHDAVKRTGRVFQVGSQGCSAGGWHKCAEMISAGKIGTLVWSQGYYCRNSKGGEWNDPPFNIDKDSIATAIDWDRWQEKVHTKIPFSPEHFHRWRKYYAHCAGIIGDLAPHRLHPLMLASGKPEFPVRVVSIGTRNVHADLGTPNTAEREVPEQQQIVAEFPSGYMITLTVGTVNAKSPGFVIPEGPFSDDIDPLTINGLVAEDLRVHEKNWFDCIRNGQPPNGNIDLAVRVQTVISLAEMSNRLNTMCLYDEKTRKITNGDGKEIPALTVGTLAQS
jgi:predicted dehydrogenase